MSFCFKFLLLFPILTLSEPITSEFFTISTTQTPSYSQTRVQRQPEELLLNYQNPTCEAVTKNTYLLEIIKLQSLQIENTLEKNFKLQESERNVTVAKLDKLKNKIDSGLNYRNEAIFGNIAKLLEYHLKTLPTIKHVENVEMRIVTAIGNLIQNTFRLHEEKLQETKHMVLFQIAQIFKKFETLTEWSSSFKEEMKNTLNNLTNSIENIKSQQLFYETGQKDSAFEIKVLQKQVQDLQKSLVSLRNLPHDCREIQNSGNNNSGLYYIQPEFSGPFQVLCDMKTKDGGWIYLMNRFDGSQNFFLNWTNYKLGFGKLTGEFWLGLENLYHLTAFKPTELLVELVDWDNKTAHAHYSSFEIGSEVEGYPLKVIHGYTGSAKDSLSYHVGRNFSTADNTKSKGGYCARHFHGAWWYKDCFISHLTGPYLKGNDSVNARQMGMHWNGFRHFNYSYSLKQVRMMVRPKSDGVILLPHEKNNN